MTYQPAMDEATKGVERYSSASGLLNSGRTLKALQDRAGDIGGRMFGDYTSGLGSLAGYGPQATPSGAGISNAIGSQADAGYARAAGIAGIGNAVSSGLGTLGYLRGLQSNSAYGA
jgi:hypothetical protein